MISKDYTFYQLGLKFLSVLSTKEFVIVMHLRIKKFRMLISKLAVVVKTIS